MDIDIYADLPHCDLGQNITALQEENEAFRAQIALLENSTEELRTTVSDMKKTQENLAKNISSLFNTAKAELARKDKAIADLRQKLDDVILRRQNRSDPRPPTKYMDTGQQGQPVNHSPSTRHQSSSRRCESDAHSEGPPQKRVKHNDHSREHRNRSPPSVNKSQDRNFDSRRPSVFENRQRQNRDSQQANSGSHSHRTHLKSVQSIQRSNSREPPNTLQKNKEQIGQLSKQVIIDSNSDNNQSDVNKTKFKNVGDCLKNKCIKVVESISDSHKPNNVIIAEEQSERLFSKTLIINESQDNNCKLSKNNDSLTTQTEKDDYVKNLHIPIDSKSSQVVESSAGDSHKTNDGINLEEPKVLLSKNLVSNKSQDDNCKINKDKDSSAQTEKGNLKNLSTPSHSGVQRNGPKVEVDNKSLQVAESDGDSHKPNDIINVEEQTKIRLFSQNLVSNENPDNSCKINKEDNLVTAQMEKNNNLKNLITPSDSGVESNEPKVEVDNIDGLLITSHTEILKEEESSDMRAQNLLQSQSNGNTDNNKSLMTIKNDDVAHTVSKNDQIKIETFKENSAPDIQEQLKLKDQNDRQLETNKIQNVAANDEIKHQNSQWLLKDLRVAVVDICKVDSSKRAPPVKSKTVRDRPREIDAIVKVLQDKAKKDCVQHPITSVVENEHEKPQLVDKFFNNGNISLSLMDEDKSKTASNNGEECDKQDKPKPNIDKIDTVQPKLRTCRDSATITNDSIIKSAKVNVGPKITKIDNKESTINEEIVKRELQERTNQAPPTDTNMSIKQLKMEAKKKHDAAIKLQNEGRMKHLEQSRQSNPATKKIGVSRQAPVVKLQSSEPTNAKHSTTQEKKIVGIGDNLGPAHKKKSKTKETACPGGNKIPEKTDSNTVTVITNDHKNKENVSKEVLTDLSKIQDEKQTETDTKQSSKNNEITDADRTIKTDNITKRESDDISKCGVTITPITQAEQVKEAYCKHIAPKIHEADSDLTKKSQNCETADEITKTNADTSNIINKNETKDNNCCKNITNKDGNTSIEITTPQNKSLNDTGYRKIQEEMNFLFGPDITELSPIKRRKISKKYQNKPSATKSSPNKERTRKNNSNSGTKRRTGTAKSKIEVKTLRYEKSKIDQTRSPRISMQSSPKKSTKKARKIRTVDDTHTKLGVSVQEKCAITAESSRSSIKDLPARETSATSTPPSDISISKSDSSAFLNISSGDDANQKVWISNFGRRKRRIVMTMVDMT